jgi:hypothetical protein
MTLEQKIETSNFLKGILRKLKQSSNNPFIKISNPVFVFTNKDKEILLMDLIIELEKEIFNEDKERRNK